MLSKFRNLYPQGSILSELIDIDRGIYIVRVSIQIDGLTLATGLAGAEGVEKAEDSARNRALQALVLEDGHLSLKLATKTSQEVATPLTVATKTNNHHDSTLPKNSATRQVQPLPKSESIPNSSTEVPPETIVPATVQAPVPNPPLTTSLLNEPSVKPTPPLEPEVIATTPPAEISPPLSEYKEEILEPTLDLTNDSYLDQKESLMESEEARSFPNEVSMSSTEAQPAIAETAVTEAPTETPAEFDFNQIRHKIDLEMKRLSWTKEQGRDYLLSTYGKRSRLHLTDDELLEFWHYLETLPN